MEKFCGCNSKWEFQGIDLRKCDLQQVNYIRDEVDREYDPSFLCEKCGIFLGTTSTTRTKCLICGG